MTQIDCAPPHTGACLAVLQDGTQLQWKHAARTDPFQGAATVSRPPEIEELNDE